jgi:nucleoside-diphosphate-sugar epimerase
MKKTNFITGFPTFTAKRLASLLASKGEKVYLLVQRKFEVKAQDFAREQNARGHGQIEVFVGDILHLDLGLSGPEIKRLSSEVTHFFHLAAIYYLGATPTLTRQVNVDGTANCLNLALEFKKIERFVFFSTAFVAGDRTGVILEDELYVGQRFRNAYEETKCQAEQIVRSRMNQLPISVVRPSVIVGDSKTGEIDRLDGPYYLIKAFLQMPARIPLPLIEGGHYPLNMVPVDFVVAGTHALSRDKRAINRTFHLTDPNPLPARKVFELIADLGGKTRPKGTIPSKLLLRVSRLPVIEKVLRPQTHFIEYVSSLTIYNCMNTLTLLAGTGIYCPPFPSFAEALVNFVLTHRQRKEDVTALEKETEEEEVFY